MFKSLIWIGALTALAIGKAPVFASDSDSEYEIGNRIESAIVTSRLSSPELLNLYLFEPERIINEPETKTEQTWQILGSEKDGMIARLQEKLEKSVLERNSLVDLLRNLNRKYNFLISEKSILLVQISSLKDDILSRNEILGETKKAHTAVIEAKDSQIGVLSRNIEDKQTELDSLRGMFEKMSRICEDRLEQQIKTQQAMNLLSEQVRTCDVCALLNDKLEASKKKLKEMIRESYEVLKEHGRALTQHNQKIEVLESNVAALGTTVKQWTRVQKN